jgi:hypothetical protein
VRIVVDDVDGVLFFFVCLAISLNNSLSPTTSGIIFVLQVFYLLSKMEHSTQLHAKSWDLFWRWFHGNPCFCDNSMNPVAVLGFCDNSLNPVAAFPQLVLSPDAFNFLVADGKCDCGVYMLMYLSELLLLEEKFKPTEGNGVDIDSSVGSNIVSLWEGLFWLTVNQLITVMLESTTDFKSVHGNGTPLVCLKVHPACGRC